MWHLTFYCINASPVPLDLRHNRMCRIASQWCNRRMYTLYGQILCNAEQEEDLDEEDAAAEAAAEEQRQAEMDEAAEEDEKTLLHPQDIDAYWLQRRIAGTFTDIDASRSQTLAEDVLTALAVSTLLGGLPSGLSTHQRACFAQKSQYSAFMEHVLGADQPTQYSCGGQACRLHSYTSLACAEQGAAWIAEGQRQRCGGAADAPAGL